MSLVLHVDESRWRSHVESVVERLGGSLIPVIKGNGYGFGRSRLMEECARLGLNDAAVGTVHELVPPPPLGAPTLHRPLASIVLSPSLDPYLDSLPPDTKLTVASTLHAAHLAEQVPGAPVIVKLATSMQRYGFDTMPSDDDLCGLKVTAFAIHPPLSGSDHEHLAEIERHLAAIPNDVEVHVSHLGLDAFDDLRQRHPQRTFRVRLGTGLWLADKSTVRLRADVTDVHAVQAGERAGYRLAPVPEDGSIVLIGAGTAHGVFANQPGSLSPFHFARTRLTLIESPHMHTSMAFIPTGQPCPRAGEFVDVQRPMIHSVADRTEWES